MPAFLLEIGLEEIPASMVAAAQQQLARGVEDLLKRERLLQEKYEVRSYSTPRRLAVSVDGVMSKQSDVEEQLVGPSLKVAYKDGVPTPAAVAFAKKAGVDVADLKSVTTAKGEYIGATVQRPGQTASDVLKGALVSEIAGIYWPKSMYWRAGKPERFVRPVRWLLALLDEEILPVEFAGVRADGLSYGHRVLHGTQPVAIKAPHEYEEKLAAAYVQVDLEARRQRIRKALDAVTRMLPGARWREDEKLVDIVTNLTEWPSVISGSFEASYLDLPEEVLVTVMRDHQKYFALEDANKKLLPSFLAVLNIEVDTAGAAVIRHGNERVLRARFNDARFFWNVDQKTPLVQRPELLKSVTFQKDLGTYWDKTQSNVRIAKELAEIVRDEGVDVDIRSLETAAHLAKTDLTAELVKEFTELQGIVGGLYAEAQGLGATTAQAIYWQYRPASAEDAIPPTIEGQIFGIADRMNTIVDMFAIGLEPTGSKDPFALRRAANGIIKILAESMVEINLSTLLEVAKKHSEKTSGTSSEESVVKFFIERLDFYLREVCRYRYDTVKAAIAVGAESVRDTVARAKAVETVRAVPDFIAISAAFKRMKNILTQAREKGEEAAPDFDESLLTEVAEQQLWHEAHALSSRVEQLRREHRYEEALQSIATLRPVVDLFFDQVMVMVPEPELRRNRLALVKMVLGDFTKIADFSEIVSS